MLEACRGNGKIVENGLKPNSNTSASSGQTLSDKKIQITTKRDSAEVSKNAKNKYKDDRGMSFCRLLKKFQVIGYFGLLLVGVAMSAWKVSSYGALILLLLYWYNGSVIYLFLLIGSLLGLLYSGQDMLLYYPEQPSNSRVYVEMPDKNIAPDGYTSVMHKTADGTKINLLLLKHISKSANAPTVIYFHGNAGNIGHRLMNAGGLHNICNLNVLLVEYRGYGRSEGSVSEEGIYKDAEAAMEYILQRSDIDLNKIVLFGRSLGGAAAIYLASRPHYAHHISALILENTFTSLPDIAGELFNIAPIHFVPECLYKNKYPSLDRIQRIAIPTLFISGQADSLIPPRMMHILYQVSASRNKHFAPIANGTHNETWTSPGYYEIITQFLKRINSLVMGWTHPFKSKTSKDVDTTIKPGFPRHYRGDLQEMYHGSLIWNTIQIKTQLYNFCQSKALTLAEKTE